MRFLIALLLWFILLALCWPLALIALFVWLILLPLKILGFAVEGVFKIVGAILMFPFKVANLMVRK